MAGLEVYLTLRFILSYCIPPLEALSSSSFNKKSVSLKKKKKELSQTFNGTQTQRSYPQRSSFVFFLSIFAFCPYEILHCDHSWLIFNIVLFPDNFLPNWNYIYYFS